jgi:hypothetical protein
MASARQQTNWRNAQLEHFRGQAGRPRKDGTPAQPRKGPAICKWLSAMGTQVPGRAASDGHGPDGDGWTVGLRRMSGCDVCTQPARVSTPTSTRVMSRILLRRTGSTTDTKPCTAQVHFAVSGDESGCGIDCLSAVLAVLAVLAAIAAAALAVIV